ncbi:N-acetylmuramoyl-L-alanine amidase [Tunicatimonas pelagia]|uniref:N-acetylmuramoyl-L-alanine amidase n=1 Tax=Tunicatimonas pelagia TaxID=931531 RepID=UPI00266676C8|nr:peptidoglycan recognition family protein [Tunicatimonas pelagia]WKN42466.1 peptidoglycan recognition family protein [Tunicatimonas pelagia]
MPLSIFLRRFSYLLVFFGCLIACKTAAPTASVQSWPIQWNQERVQLSLDYMQEHYGMNPDYPAITPQMIVVHWTAIPTLQASYQAFYDSRLPGSRATIGKASPLNVSVPYLIDRDGAVYQLMADTLFARHVIGLNHCAIGIENVGDGNDYPLTEAQLQANEQLIRTLVKKYNIHYVIGHHEYQQFIGHPLWKEKDANYLTEKTDPGDDFMRRLRSELSDLTLDSLPKKSVIQQGVAGQVRWYEGNLMPTITEDTAAAPDRQGEPVQRTLYIHKLTHRDQTVQKGRFFQAVQTELVAKITTDSLGKFELSLPVGQYSLLVEETEGLFANQFNSEGHIAPFSVESNRVTQLNIRVDYRATY